MTISRNTNDNSRPSAPPIELLAQEEQHLGLPGGSYGLSDDIPNPQDLGPPPTYEQAMKQNQNHDSLEHHNNTNNHNLPDDDDDPDGSSRPFTGDSSNNSMSSLRDHQSILNHNNTPPRSSSRGSSSHRGLSGVKDKKKGSKIKRGLEQFAFAIIQLLD